MKTYNIIKGIFAATVLSVVFSGCSEDAMDRINKDHGHTQSVAARFILTDVITSTAFSNAGGDFNTYLSAYIEYEVGVDNQLYYAETRESEPTSSSTFNNTWVWSVFNIEIRPYHYQSMQRGRHRPWELCNQGYG